MTKKIKWAKIDIQMIYSPAFQDLNLAARKILDYALLQKVWKNTQPQTRKPKWECVNGDKIRLPYTIFVKKPFKMHRQSIVRGIDSLLEHGFLKMLEQGGAFRGQSSVYKFSGDWKGWREGKVMGIRKSFISKGFCKK